MDGEGLYTWADGRRYQGQYVQDKKHGRGKYTWANGRSYDGEWKDGKQHGEGSYYNPEADVTKRGIWENGKRLQWLAE